MSSAESTAPVGLCGEFKMIAFVFVCFRGAHFFPVNIVSRIFQRNRYRNRAVHQDIRNITVVSRFEYNHFITRL